MKVRTYGALMGALLTISTAEAAEAATCNCVSTPPKHHAATERHAPAHIVRHSSGADAEYAKSYYDYRSASRVGEVFVRGEPAPADDGWRVAPNDAHIRFYRDERVIYVPVAAYPPPPAYYPPAYYPAPGGVHIDEQGFNNGVGYGGGMGGSGGGGGGQAFLYTGQSGGSAMPANGGGVNLPGGYGPDYHGNWQGPAVPTAGGGASVGR